MKTYSFDVRMTATIHVPASSEADARAELAENMFYCQANFGAWPDGEPILGEATIVGEAELVGQSEEWINDDLSDEIKKQVASLKTEISKKKIWVIHTDTDAGSNMFLFYTEEDANRWALEWCAALWSGWYVNEYGPMPTDHWTDAYEYLSDGGDQWLHMQEFEVDTNRLIGKCAADV